MDVILLAAGIGKRLRPITKSIPKCLAPVNGYPILLHWLDHLNQCDPVSRIFINTHYLKELVNEFLNEINGLKKEIIILNEPALLGTGQTVKNIIQKFNFDEILIIHADNYSSIDIRKLHQKYKTLKDQNKKNIICSFNTNDPKSCGMIEINNKNIMIDYIEKPLFHDGKIANAAIFITDKEELKDFFDNFPKADDLAKDFLPTLINQAYIYPIENYHIDIGTIANLKSANNLNRRIINLKVNKDWLNNYHRLISELELNL